MKEKNDLIEELPWGEIFDQVHQHYDQILEEYFSDDPKMLELFSYTQIGLRYDPESLEDNPSSTRQEAATVWDELGSQVTANLRALLIEEYQVPIEFAQAMQVGTISVAFLSPATKKKSCAEWHQCEKGGWFSVPCPC